jgi:predicted RNase H-like HicB family nuclease
MAKGESNVRINLSAIVYPEDGAWIAHCLELDIVAEGASSDEAVQSLVSLCDFQIKVAMEEGDLRSIFRPAPAETWQMFASGREKRIAGRRAPLRKGGFKGPVNRFEARQLSVA